MKSWEIRKGTNKHIAGGAQERMQLNRRVRRSPRVHTSTPVRRPPMAASARCARDVSPVPCIWQV
eukprot:364507-Chlamydomonas_euryale.AAC.1